MRRAASVVTWSVTWSVALVAACASLSAQNWPSFRGPSASGVADGTPTAVHESPCRSRTTGAGFRRVSAHAVFV